MDDVSREVLMPLNLLISYSLLLYLGALYWHRRREFRVQCLFLAAVVSVLALIPFANDDELTVARLNDASEASSVVTFLLQIAITSFDLNQKMRFRSILFLGYVAEVLALADFALAITSIVLIFYPEAISRTSEDQLTNSVETMILVFVVCFRVYFIAISRGWREICRSKKLDIMCFLAFALHEVPFEFLEGDAGFDGAFMEAFVHRLSIACCLWVTVRGKTRLNSSRRTSNSKLHSSRTLRRQSLLQLKSALSNPSSAHYVVAVATTRNE